MNPRGDEPGSGHESPSTGRPSVVDIDKRVTAARVHGALFGAGAFEPVRVGRYAVLDRLGSGAMGVVYRAYDEALDRMIAIKFIHSALLQDPSACARLLREARAMAAVSHPHVIPIHDTVETYGQPFIVMELVAGGDLRGWLEGRRPGEEGVLAMFLAIGEGLCAAHRAGIVHRDFKPENVLLSKAGEPKVGDFGLAGVEASPSHPDEAAGGSVHRPTSGLTKAGALIGTPRYMAPEQHLARVADARSDQFAFCVTLYEALYGQCPFEGEEGETFTANVLAGRVRPAPVGTKTPLWLDTVVRRGLQVDPCERWPSMEALLAALRDDPARRRRTRRFIGLAAAMGLVALGAWQVDQYRGRAQCRTEAATIEQVWNAARREELHAAFLSTGVGHAAETYRRTVPWLDRYALDWSAARERVCRRGLEAGSRACFDEGAARFAGLVERLSQRTPSTLEDAVPSAASLPKISSCEDARWLVTYVGLPEDPVVRARALRLQQRLARTSALRNIARADDVAHAMLAEADAVRQAAAALPWPPLAAEAKLAMGDAYVQLGRFDDANDAYQRGFLSAGATGQDRSALRAAAALAKLHAGKLADPEQGLLWIDLGQMYVERLGVEGDLAVASLEESRGAVQYQRDALELAIAAYERALRIRQTHLGDGHPDAIMPTASLGSLYELHHDFDRAEETLRRALELAVATVGRHHPQYANALQNLGALMLQQERYTEAKLIFEEIAVIQEATLRPNHPDLASTLLNLGHVHSAQGDEPGALKVTQRALAIWKTALGPTHPKVAMALENLGTTAMRMGQYPEARDALEQALSIGEAAYGPRHPWTGNVLNSLGTVAQAQNDPDRALDLFDRALAALEVESGPEHPDRATVYNNQGNLYLARKEYDRAIVVYERSVALREQHYGAEHLSVARTLVNLGLALEATGALDEAARIETRALTIFENALGPRHGYVAAALLALGTIHAAQGEDDQASRELDRALEIAQASADGLVDPADIRQQRAQLSVREGEAERAVARGPGR